MKKGAKSDKASSKLHQEPSKKQDIELVPDAWPRFEKFIREIAKAGPQHRKPIEKPKAKAQPAKKTRR